MKKKFNYDPARELFDSLMANDLSLEYVFNLFGSEREAVRIMKHRLSDGEIELYEFLGPVKRFIDAWELDELTRNMTRSKKGADKLKEVFAALTKKGKERLEE
jgi:hypothetical protein